MSKRANSYSLKHVLFSYQTLKHYSVSLENGKLKISLSEAWFSRSIIVLSLIALVSLACFIYLYIYFPPVEKRWIALAMAAAIGVLMTGMMLLIVIMGVLRVYTFDRDTDGVLLRSRMICRMSEIGQVEVAKENRSGGQGTSYVLLIVFHGGKRKRLFNRLPPPDELIELANTIGDYIGVSMVKPA